MSLPNSFYLNAATLAAATEIFVDEQLTTCAPDGYYSDGVIVRQLVNCGLLPAIGCPNCCSTNCVSWEVVIAANERAAIRYRSCGNENKVIDFGEPLPYEYTYSLCVKKGFSPSLVFGIASYSISFNCGCCLQDECQTWRIDELTTPTVVVVYINCNDVEMTEVISEQYDFCVKQGTTPVITEGSCSLDFLSCGCEI
jgi:hypothetical protein